MHGRPFARLGSALNYRRSPAWVQRFAHIFSLVAILPGNSIPSAAEPADEKETRAQETRSATTRKRFEGGAEIRWHREFRVNPSFRKSVDFDHFFGQHIRVDLRVQISPRQSAYRFDLPACCL